MHAATVRLSAASRSVVLTCLAVAILDGLDLLMFGVVLPVLLEEPEWGLTKVSAGLIGSLSLLGMMIGAMVAGYVTDIVGRRPVVLVCVAGFSIFTGLRAAAGSVEMFSILRFLAGLGFGGALPTVIALTMEYVRPERRQFFSGVIFAGFPIGGGLISIIGIIVVPTLGWRALFLGAGLIGILLFVVAYRNLPESLALLTSRGRQEEARRLAERYHVEQEAESLQSRKGADGISQGSALKSLFGPGYRLATVLFPVFSFCGLLLAYGLNTWTPQILRSIGYDLGAALFVLLGLQLGAVLGTVSLTWLAERFGPRKVIAAGFVGGAAAVSVLALRPALGVVFVLLFVVGYCTGAQPAGAAFAGVYYPAHARGTALGLTIGVGRLGGILGPTLIGMLVASSIGATGTFYVLAATGVLAAVVILAIPRGKTAGHRAEIAAITPEPEASPSITDRLSSATSDPSSPERD